MNDIDRFENYIATYMDMDNDLSFVDDFMYPVLRLLKQQQQRIELLERKNELALDTIGKILKIGAGD